MSACQCMYPETCSACSPEGEKPDDAYGKLYRWIVGKVGHTSDALALLRNVRSTEESTEEPKLW